MPEQFYRKVGKRYKPVATWEYIHELGSGYWLTCSEKGVASTRPVEPDYTGFFAAANKARVAMVEAVRKAAELRPASKPITPAQRDAWKELQNAMGENRWSVLEGASIQDIVDAGIEAVRKELK